jgi:membrane protein required for colicin V production
MSDYLEAALAAVTRFNAWDWFVLGVWIISAGYGVVRGFAREVLSVIGWIAAFFIAKLLATSVAEVMQGVIEEPTTRYLIAWILTFIAVLLVFGLIAAFLSKQMRQPGFNLGNRLLGAFFGLARGILIVALVSVVLRAVVPKEEQGLINQAVLMDPVDWVAEWVGANFERVLEAEPTEAVKETLDSTEML